MAAESAKAVRFHSRYAGLVLQDADGVWARFEDGVLETTDAAIIKRLRALDAETTGVREDTAEQAPPPADSAPAKSGSKGDWVAWAVRCGADQAAAEALTRDQLAEQYGAATPKG